MSMPNPFLPAGSLMAERQRRNRAQFKLAVYVVLTAHAMLVLGLLIEGCKSDDPANGASGPEPSGPATTAANPTPAAQPRPQANPRASRAALTATPALSRQPPPSSIPQPGSAGLIYVVKSGDTVPRIAKAHGTTAQALRAANSLTNDRLVVGMKLKVPARPG